MNGNMQINKIFKLFIWAAFILAITSFIFIVLTPILSHNQELCSLYRNTIRYYKIIALGFMAIGLMGLYIKQHKRLSVGLLIFGLMNGLLSFIYYFSSACIVMY